MWDAPLQLQKKQRETLPEIPFRDAFPHCSTTSCSHLQPFQKLTTLVSVRKEKVLSEGNRCWLAVGRTAVQPDTHNKWILSRHPQPVCTVVVTQRTHRQAIWYDESLLSFLTKHHHKFANIIITSCQTYTCTRIMNYARTFARPAGRFWALCGQRVQSVANERQAI